MPLQRGRLAFTRDPGWQMSLGERAAFEGVLAQLRAKLAVEIGTADGGSLERIATYGAEVIRLTSPTDRLPGCSRHT